MSKNDIAAQLEKNRRKPSKNRLLDRLPNSEKQWSQLEISPEETVNETEIAKPTAGETAKKTAEATARLLASEAKKPEELKPASVPAKSPTFKMTMNVFPQTYDMFEEMLSAGKRVGLREVGLTLQHNELFAVMCQHLYATIFKENPAEFERRLVEILGERRSREGK